MQGWYNLRPTIVYTKQLRLRPFILQKPHAAHFTIAFHRSTPSAHAGDSLPFLLPLSIQENLPHFKVKFITIHRLPNYQFTNYQFTNYQSLTENRLQGQSSANKFTLLAAMADPETCAYYEARTEKEGRQPFLVAMSDYFKGENLLKRE